MEHLHGRGMSQGTWSNLGLAYILLLRLVESPIYRYFKYSLEILFHFILHLMGIGENLDNSLKQ